MKNEKELDKKLIEKISYKNYTDKELMNIDVDAKHLENAFSSLDYYKSMKPLPLLQKQILYLLVVDGYSIKQVAKILNIKKIQVTRLKKQAIKTFKKNLRKNRGEK